MEGVIEPRKEEEDRKRNEISRWLIDSCDMVPEKALAVQHQLCEEFCHTSVRAVQEMLELMPDLLTHLKLPEPTRMRLENKIRSYNTKRIERLSRTEVQIVLDWFYMGEGYGSKIAAHGVNGFVLSTSGSLDRLKDWGVTDPTHAEGVHARIVQWKKHGVPRDFLIALPTDDESDGDASGNSEAGSTIGVKREHVLTATALSTAAQEPSSTVNDVSGEEDGQGCSSSNQPSAKRSRTSAPVVESSPVTMATTGGDAGGYGDGEQTADSEGESEEEGAGPTAPAAGSATKARAATKPKGRHLSRELESLKRWSLYDVRKRSTPTPAPVATTRSSRARVAKAKATAPTGSSVSIATAPANAASSRSQPITGISSSSGSGNARQAALRVAPTGAAAPSAPAAQTKLAQTKVKQESQPSRAVDCKQLLRGLSSNDTAVRADTLHQVSKEIDKDPEVTASFVPSGVYDKVLAIVAGAERETDEVEVWRALVALNNSIALGGPAVVKYLVDRGVIGMMQQLCPSKQIRWRLQALWTLGNIAAVPGTDVYKEAVVRDDTVRMIVQSYATIGQMEGVAPEDVHRRYAETIMQFASQCTLAQARRLILFRGILVDLITTQVSARTVHPATVAVSCLLAAKEFGAKTDRGIVTALLDAGIVEALVSRLQDAKVAVIQHALQALYNVAEGCDIEGDQLYELEPMVKHLGRFILWARTGSGNDRVSLLALDCVRLLSEGGSQVVKMVNEGDPRLYDEVWAIVLSALHNQTAVDPNSGKKAVCAAHALLAAVPGAAPDDWHDFVKQGIYGLAFQVLVAFERSPEVVHAALLVLENMLDQGSGRLTGTKKDWEAVRSLVRLAEGDSGSKGLSKPQLENSKVARRLWNTAREMGVV